jgi:hypothetical protein
VIVRKYFVVAVQQAALAVVVQGAVAVVAVEARVLGRHLVAVRHVLGGTRVTDATLLAPNLGLEHVQRIGESIEHVEAAINAPHFVHDHVVQTVALVTEQIGRANAQIQVHEARVLHDCRVQCRGRCDNVSADRVLFGQAARSFHHHCFVSLAHHARHTLHLLGPVNHGPVTRVSE